MTSKSVLIVDLGVGNLRSVARAFERAGASATISPDPDAVRKSSVIVVPGQGAFRDCAIGLQRGFREALLEAIAAGKPYMGLCLGMQVLFERSEEAPGAEGLGLFKGTVNRFARELRDDVTGERLKVPHMGWNEVRGQHRYLPERGWFYFVHSFYCAPQDEKLTVGTAHYGHDFCTAVARDNVFACQFHPEKSQEEGQQLLERFVAQLGRPSASAERGL
jgi:imidazole glycerol-phosphate synthase subunit HisH